ncbi:signal peptidase I [Ramlibacter sp. G-1-2-2]|uniref:Signal peptidase I n=1 Tax=Ramlibacter agri TaxID=2728837 RepID=A0A848H7X6_9BURK|nr:signal peptidase I [Ramlibacter agri]NML47096.1 signal peptidase I [Ramlibacter agri]
MIAWLRRNRGFLLFLIGFGLFRTAIADYNPIPSGSMRPTLLEGDVVLVNRLAYDLKVPLTDVSLARLGEPQRGDVVTFHSPKDGERLIKRIVGLPGDVIAMRDEVLYVNGKPCSYSETQTVREPVGTEAWTEAVRATEALPHREHAVQFLPAVAARRDFAATVVPPDQFFMLGDNRDDSADSRYIGFVPRQLLIGRAHHLLVSADILASWQPRFGRFAKAIE